MDHSTAANDPRSSASFSALKNPQRIPVNTPPVFLGLRPCIWSHLIRLVTKAMSDRLLAKIREQPGSLGFSSSFVGRNGRLVLQGQSDGVEPTV
jgi:hypothetical protein